MDEAEAEAIPARDEFRIAIICAVGKEGDAVERLFDQKWTTRDLGRQLGDDNTYSLGRIGGVMVVVVWLPKYGKSSASVATAQLYFSFTRIEHVLIVGICGGVPVPGGRQELFLGDVVISTKLQLYDQGKQNPDGYIPTRTASPRGAMGSFLNMLEGSGGSRRTLYEYLNRYLRHMLLRDEEYAAKVEYPGQDQDVLFSPTHIHKHYEPSQCSVCINYGLKCENSKRLSCSELNCNVPQGGVMRYRHDRDISRSGLDLSIHFGTVGSGDTVMKSAEHRDRIAQRDNVIAFEMEGSGAFEKIESVVVIKGVCDYADSHKNKRWQDYAAAVAAACTGAFLEMKEEQFGVKLPSRRKSSASVGSVDWYGPKPTRSRNPLTAEPISYELGEPAGRSSRSFSDTRIPSATPSRNQLSRTSSNSSDSPMTYGAWSPSHGSSWNVMYAQRPVFSGSMSHPDIHNNLSSSSHGGVSIAASWSQPQLPTLMPSPPPQKRRSIPPVLPQTPLIDPVLSGDPRSDMVSRAVLHTKTRISWF